MPIDSFLNHKSKKSNSGWMLGMFVAFQKNLQDCLKATKKRQSTVIKEYVRLINQSIALHQYNDTLDYICELHFMSARSTKKDLFPGVEYFQLDKEISGLNIPEDQLENIYPMTMGFLSDFKEKFNVFGKESVPLNSAGVACTHQIWLGKMLEEETLVKIAATNIQVESRWEKKSGQRFRHIIWTNNKQLLQLGFSRGRIEFRDVADLLDHAETPRVLAVRTRSYIEWSLFASASDILRMLAVYYYGGLYRDVTWQAYFMYNPWQEKIFSPVSEDVMISSENQRFVVSKQIQPHRFFDSEYCQSYVDKINSKKLFNIPSMWESLQYTDINLFYVGKAKHDFMLSVIDHLALVLSCKGIEKGVVQHASLIRDDKKTPLQRLEILDSTFHCGSILFEFAFAPASFEFIYQMKGVLNYTYLKIMRFLF